MSNYSWASWYWAWPYVKVPIFDINYRSALELFWYQDVLGRYYNNIVIIMPLKMVEMEGIEPPTFCLQSRRSTPELHPQTIVWQPIRNLYNVSEIQSTDFRELSRYSVVLKQRIFG